MPKYLETQADFDEALKNAGDKVVVIDFTASWCGPCQMIGPKFEAMSQEFTSLDFYKVDVDKNDETAERQGIQAMPTFQFFKNGKKIDDMRGANEAKLREMIQKYAK
ncbi:PREDICTED: thioredoxin-like [Amphimedon queenslandica]|uniref:Thioredoxin n=2 Tax=Amphimedon queenslandica TaxID=400682 RepID=A0A1X7VQB2_AMPQE|nr:PREDICTED: thioredoxin-like [Amphimedon queenslandica]|eukprot:XP_003383163.1 PREDICTED: thioredoxin-like [Amphimedon queenslandica]